MYEIVMLRHGESQWNLENRFTGWHDVDLTENGRAEARRAGELLKEKGYRFDAAYTSVLKRAIRTLWITLDTLDQMWLPVTSSWKLNERHYGALTGLNKSETAAQYGEEQVLIWRRSYDIRPGVLADDAAFSPVADPRYAGLGAELPRTECLKDTVERVVPYWEETIAPAVRSGRRILIAAHGNSLRALIKHLDQLSESEVIALNIPTAQPLVYRFDRDMKPLGRSYLADPSVIEAALAAVAAQGKAKA